MPICRSCGMSFDDSEMSPYDPTYCSYCEGPSGSPDPDADSLDAELDGFNDAEDWEEEEDM